MSDETTITDANYRENLNRVNAVVLFYKKLCPNCKALEKMLEKFFAVNPEVQYKRIDSEECPEAMKTFDVSLVPTLLILKGGIVAGKKVGLMNLKEMTDFHRSV
ncbi:MAG: thioredoxin family protein [Desulfomonilaceae bacterium]